MDEQAAITLCLLIKIGNHSGVLVSESSTKAVVTCTLVVMTATTLFEPPHHYRPLETDAYKSSYLLTKFYSFNVINVRSNTSDSIRNVPLAEIHSVERRYLSTRCRNSVKRCYLTQSFTEIRQSAAELWPKTIFIARHHTDARY